MSSRIRLMLAVREWVAGLEHVCGELAVDGIGQAALEAPQGFHRGLPAASLRR